VLGYTPAIVLDLGGVDFIDSGGLGLLVRMLSRTGQGNLKLCRATSRVSEVLKITRLSNVFDCYDSESEAIAAFYTAPAGGARQAPFAPASVLCVEDSADLLTYIQAVLRQTGLSVMTTNNLPDAVTLLKAMTPKVVLVGQELRSAGSAGIVETFDRLLSALAVIELSPELARQDPAETGPQLVERVRGLIESRA
jgi:CheY-like chemotaxis protein